MALNEDLSLRMFLNTLMGIAETYKPNFDADVAKYLETLESNISALLRHPDSPPVSSGPNSKDDFQNAKHEILGRMNELYAQMENNWQHHLSRMKLEFLKKIDEFLQNTKLEVKLPIPEVLYYGANSDSTNSIYPYGPDSSPFRLNQESTQTSNFMSSSSQDTSKLLHHIKVEDMEPQGFANMSLNYLAETPCTQFVQAISLSPAKAPTNQLVSYSTTSASNASYQSFTPCKDTQSPPSAPRPEPVTYSTPNATTLISALNYSTENVTDQNLNFESRPITVSAPQIEPSDASPKKKFDCLYCKRSYNHESELQRHMPRHTGEKSYVCTYCGKGFPYQGARDNHKKICKKRTGLEQ